MIRIKALASLINPGESVIDIGTDHAYLPIFLYENNITKQVAGSDISSNVLKYGFQNLAKHRLLEKIELYESDGFENLFNTYDVAVISGMGTTTIKHILNSHNIPKNLIISTHNDLPQLRLFMQKLGYSIQKEIIVKEKNRYYDIIRYIHGKEVLTNEEILLGKSNSREYLKYLYQKYLTIYTKSHQKIYQDYLSIIEKKLAKM